MGTQIDRIVAETRKIWRPPPRLRVSQWAGRFRFLSPESSAEPGLWSNARAPHLRMPMDLLSPYSPTERVVCLFSSQSGKTEVLLNFIGYIIDCDPGPILAIQPNVTPMGEAFSKDRIVPMLRDSPTLAAKAGAAKARSSASTITHKTFPGGHLTIAGANSPAGLASRPIRYLICDEIDRWEATKEGDPLLLARKRLQTFRARRAAKEVIVSSPTYDDVGISVEYAKCERQHEWQLKCQHCHEYQFPRLKHFHHQNGENIRYICGHCGSEHPLGDEDRVKGSGKWVCRKDDGEISVGFRMNQWASPFARWDDTLQEWLSAGKDPMQRQAVKNTVFAETWDGEGDQIDPHALEAREEKYTAEVPEGVAAITIGVDCQLDRLELEVVGWGAGESSWSIAYHVLPGEPTGADVWVDLADLYERRWEHENGTMMRPAAMAIDSGAWSKNVYAFVAARKDPRIYPVKGSSTFGADVLTGTRAERRRRENKRMLNGRPAEMLGVSQIKRIVMKRLLVPRGTPGACHFPEGRGREYYDQLTGERLITVSKRGKRPQMAWHRVHDQVEALDCRVYAYAAMLLVEPDLSVQPSAPVRAQPKQKEKPYSPGGRRRLIR